MPDSVLVLQSYKLVKDVVLNASYEPEDSSEKLIDLDKMKSMMDGIRIRLEVNSFNKQLENGISKVPFVDDFDPEEVEQELKLFSYYMPGKIYDTLQKMNE